MKIKWIFILFLFINNLSAQDFKRLDSLKQEFKNTTNSITNRVNALSEMSHEYLYQDNDSALFYCDKLFEFSRNNNSDYGLAEAHFAKGNYYKSVVKLDSSIYHYKKAIYNARLLKNIDLNTNYQLELSTAYLSLSNFDEAIKHNKIAENLVKKSGNVNQQGIVYVNYGLIFYKKEQLDLAIKNLQKADSIFTVQKVRNIDYGNTLFNLGNIYFKTENHPKSIQYFKRVKQYYKETGVTFGVEVVNLKLAEIALKQKKYNQAIPQLIKVVSFFKTTGNKEFIGRSSNTLGKAYFETNKIDFAIKILTEAEKVKITPSKKVAFGCP